MGIKQTRVPPKPVGFITDTLEQYFRIKKAELPQLYYPFPGQNASGTPQNGPEQALNKQEYRKKWWDSLQTLQNNILELRKRNYRNFIKPFPAKNLPERPGTGI